MSDMLIAARIVDKVRHRIRDESGALSKLWRYRLGQECEAAIAQARAEERERCAVVLDVLAEEARKASMKYGLANNGHEANEMALRWEAIKDAAAAIRTTDSGAG